MARAILIDAANRAVREVQCNTLKDMQEFVGGYIELAHRFPNGDWMIVDEEGKLEHKKPRYFFLLESSHDTFAGNGLIVGPDLPNEEGQADATIDIEVVRRMLRFGIYR